MQLKNGNLILSNDERNILHMATMNQIDGQYESTYFLSSLNKIKVSAADIIAEFESKQIPDVSDPLRIELTQQLIDICDLMIERAHDAARVAGQSIEFH